MSSLLFFRLRANLSWRTWITSWTQVTCPIFTLRRSRSASWLPWNLWFWTWDSSPPNLTSWLPTSTESAATSTLFSAWGLSSYQYLYWEFSATNTLYKTVACKIERKISVDVVYLVCIFWLLLERFPILFLHWDTAWNTYSWKLWLRTSVLCLHLQSSRGSVPGSP